MVRLYLRNILYTTFMDDRDYEIKVQAGAYLQADSINYMLIECYNGGIAATKFVKYLNNNYDRFVKNMNKLWKPKDIKYLLKHMDK